MMLQPKNKKNKKINKCVILLSRIINVQRPEEEIQEDWTDTTDWLRGMYFDLTAHPGLLFLEELNR